MFWVHATVGYLIFAVVVFLLIWNLYRVYGQKSNPVGGRIVTGLVDLQILLGIITFIVHPVYGLFLFHPVIMVIMAVIVHIMLRKNSSTGRQISGFVIATILLIGGIGFASL